MSESTTLLLTEPTSATSINPPRIEQPTRLSPDVVAHMAGALRSDVGELSQDVARVHGDSLRIQLKARTDEAAKRAPADLLSELAGYGFSWTAVARIIGVSIPALRKWRHGEAATGENRRKLAELVALVGVLASDHVVFEIASWMEVPLAGSTFTAIDVLAAGQIGDLMEYAAGHLESDELLDRAVLDWRETLDGRFEAYLAGDGERAIRLSGQGDTV